MGDTKGDVKLLVQKLGGCGLSVVLIGFGTPLPTANSIMKLQLHGQHVFR